MTYSYADDHLAEYLRCAPVPHVTTPYEAASVPRHVHQIWLGEKPVPRHVDRWRDFCRTHGWEHSLWRESDILREGLKNEDLFEKYGHGRVGEFGVPDYQRRQAQSDVARYEILHTHGGLYVDCDIVPAYGGTIDLADYLPMSGFAISTEHVPRNIKTGALFAANGFMLSCPGHPILERVITSVPMNVESFLSNGVCDIFWMSGPFLLNKCLFGIFHVIHRDWVMVDANPPKNHFHLVEFERY